MANTQNLDLEEISVNDNIKTTFIQKLNNNQAKIDNAYGYLKEHLLENTGKDNLNDAIEYVSGMHEDIVDLQNEINELSSVGNASANEIVSGKTALVQGEEITGTLINKVVNVSLEGTYSGTSYLTMSGAALNGDTLVIYAQAASTAAEHIYFTTSSIIGTKGSGWDTYPAGTSDPITVMYACTITGLNNYNTINVTLNANSRNTSYDYIGIAVTVTGS